MSLSSSSIIVTRLSVATLQCSRFIRMNKICVCILYVLGTSAHFVSHHVSYVCIETSGSQNPSREPSLGVKSKVRTIYSPLVLGSRGSKYKAPVGSYQFAGRKSKHIHVMAYHENHLLKAKFITYKR